MATNDIEIRLSVSGGQQAEKQIERVEKASIDLSDSAKGVGETFSSVSEAVEKSGGLMAGGFAAVGDSVMSAAEGIMGFADAAKVAGETGGKAWLGMLGPIALLISAVGSIVEALREFSGAAREAEMWEEAMSATASDLTSRMEALAETGLIPTNRELEEFIKLNQRARFSLELLGLNNEKLVKLYKEQDDALRAVSDAKKQMVAIETQNAKATKVTEKAFLDQVKSLPDLISLLWEVEDATSSLHNNQIELDKANKKIADSEKELARIYKDEVIPQLQAALKAQEISSKTQLQLDDAYYEKLKQIEDLEVEKLDLQGKQKVATDKIGQATRSLTTTQKQRQEQEKLLNDQLKKNIITQDQYDKSILKLKGDVYDQTKALDDQIEALNRELRALKDADAKKSRMSSDSVDREQKAYDRRIELLNREKQARQELLDPKYVKEERERLRVMYDIAKAYLGGEEDKLQGAIKLEQELLAKQQETDKKLLNEQLARDLKTKVGISANTKKIEADVSKYLDELSKNRKVRNRKDLDDLLDDYKDRYTKLGASSRKLLKTNLADTMSDLLKEEAGALESQRDMLRMGQNEREKDAFDSIKKREDEIKGIAESVKVKRELALTQFQTEKAISLERIELERAIFEERDLALREEKDKIQAIAEQTAEFDPNIQDAFLSFYGLTSKDIEEQSAQLQKAIDENMASLTSAEKNLERQRREFAIKEKQLKEEGLIYNRKYSEESIQGLSLMFSTEESIREDALKTMEEQERAMLSIRQKGVAKLDSDIQDSTKAINEALQIRASLEQKYREAGVYALMELAEGEMLTIQEKMKLLGESAKKQKEVYASLTQDEERRVREAEGILDIEGTILRDALRKKEELIGDSNERIALMNQQAKEKEIESSVEQFRAIGDMLKDFYITQVQTIASGIGQIFFDDTADQKLKELDANRKDAMAQYKTDMKARAEIEKQYLQQKRAIQAEDEQAISNMLKATLRAAAQEALVKSIFHTGMGIGALAMGPLGGMSAAGHFKAAAVFAGLAAIAGLSSKAAGSPTSASASTSLSPTGASQTTTAPIREEARNTEPIVFNINLAGATVYDTRAAAEQAMADRIISMASRTRRGNYNTLSRA